MTTSNKNFILELKQGGFVRFSKATSRYFKPTQEEIESLDNYFAKYNYSLNDVKSFLIVDNYLSHQIVLTLKNGSRIEHEFNSEFNDLNDCFLGYKNKGEEVFNISESNLTLWHASSY